MFYPENGTRGRCPECQRSMVYVACFRGDMPGTWFHVSEADRDACPDGDGRY